MNKILKVIDDRVDKIKLNNSKNKDHLILTDKEYEILKDSLTSLDDSEILVYRGLLVRVKKQKIRVLK